MGGSCSDHVALIGYLLYLITQGKRVDRDGLGVQRSPPWGSFSQSSPSLFWPASGLRLCIQSPQREWSTRPFMCRGMLGFSQCSSPPSASLKAPSSVVPVETRVAPPAAVSSPPMPHFQNALLRRSSLDHTTTNQTKWWVKMLRTYCTAQPGDFTLLLNPTIFELLDITGWKLIWGISCGKWSVFH